MFDSQIYVEKGGMVMKTRNHEMPYGNEKINKLYLWSIIRQDDISSCVRTYVWSAVYAILLISLLIPIDLAITLQIIFFGGLMACGLLWVFVERRRSWLLTIQDPVLKETAHRVMIAYLKNKLDGHPCCPESEDIDSCITC